MRFDPKRFLVISNLPPTCRPPETTGACDTAHLEIRTLSNHLLGHKRAPISTFFCFLFIQQ